jgi:hypothetical protein
MLPPNESTVHMFLISHHHYHSKQYKADREDDGKTAANRIWSCVDTVNKKDEACEVNYEGNNLIHIISLSIRSGLL